MSEMKSSRFTEDVTTEPEIVSLTSATGAEAIRKDVNKDASISDKFGRKDSPDASFGLMIIRFRLGLFIQSSSMFSDADRSWRPMRFARPIRVNGRHDLPAPERHVII